jgi:hypothetical protein
MWHCVSLVLTDVSDEPIASISRPPAHTGSSLPDFSTLKMAAIRSSETSVNTRPTHRYIPEDDILHVYYYSVEKLLLLVTILRGGHKLQVFIAKC